MATNEEILRSFIVALDWKNEAAQQKQFVGAIKSATLKANLLADGIVAMAKSISGSIESASQDFLKLGLLASQTKASVQTIISLQQALKQVGASPDDAVSLIRNVNHKLRELNDGYLESYKKFGITKNKLTGEINLDFAKGQVKSQKILAKGGTAALGLWADMLGITKDQAQLISEHGAQIEDERQKAQKSLEAFGFNQDMVNSQSRAAKAINGFWFSVNNAWNDLLTTAEKPITTQLEKLDKWIEENPDAFKALMLLGGGVTAAGGAKVVGGLIARTLGFGGPANALTGSAHELSGSAKALDLAAEKLSASGGGGAGGKVAEAAEGAAGSRGRAMRESG